MAASAAYTIRSRQVAGHAIHSQYRPASTHASGRSIPAAASTMNTGTPRRGRSASSAAAHTTIAMYGMSM